MSAGNAEDIAINVAIAKKVVDDAIKLTEERFKQSINEIEEVRSPRGPRGFEGKQGPRGPIGPKSDDGIDGEPGEKGEPGEDGIDGIDGEPGEKGEPGIDGRDGKDGAPGKPGKPGEKGDKGDKGEPGKEGKQGKTGKPGAKGKTGAKGKAGTKGKDGKDGKDGKPGIAGKKGEKGEKGDKGEQGEHGKDAPLPDLKPLQVEIDERFSKLQKGFETRFNSWSSQAMTSAYSMTGGGSVKILDNDDVQFNQPSELANNDVLVWDASIKKFSKINMVTLLNDLGVITGVAAQYDKLVDEAGAGITYIGERDPGTGSVSTAVWRIKRIDESASPIEILYADGVATFNKIWNDRATYTYTAL